MYEDICSGKIKPAIIKTKELNTSMEKKLNKILFLAVISLFEVQKFTIAVSNANMQTVNKYCQKDSRRFMFAITSDENTDVYKGISIKETNLVATLLNP